MPIVMECAKLRAIVRDESLELLLHPESRLKQRKKPAKQEIHRLEVSRKKSGVTFFGNFMTIAGKKSLHCSLG